MNNVKNIKQAYKLMYKKSRL